MTTHTPTTTPAADEAAPTPKPARKRAAAKKAAAAPAPAPVAPVAKAASTVSKEGEMTCRLCERTLAVTKFPTSRTSAGDVVRVDRCRECRDGVTPEGKAARKAAAARKAKAAAKAAK